MSRPRPCHAAQLPDGALPPAVPPRAVQVVIVAALCLFAASPSLAQSHQIVPLESPAYRYVTRLQHRGRLLALPPTALPYTRGAIRRALRAADRAAWPAVEKRWAARLKDLVSPRSPAPQHVLVGGQLRAGGAVATTRRLDVLRPTGTPVLLPRASATLFLEKGVLIAQGGLRYDRYYSIDPDGLDAARRLAIRSEEAYLGLRTRPVSAYLGRYLHHWGPAGRPALVISRNPRAFDHLFFRLGGGRLALRSMLGELDNIGADDTYTGRDFVPGSKRRYLAAHRLDWRPSRNVTLTLMESALYSGTQAGPSLKFLNPMHTLAFVIANKPMNTQHNGFLGASLWAHMRGLTLYGQFLLDDFDFVTGSEPASLAATTALTYGAVTPAVDVSASLTLATARAYNTPQAEGRYVYLLRGLALPFSDYVRSEFAADVYLDGLLPGLAARPYVEVLWQGESDFRAPYPPHRGVATLLEGVVERTVRPALGLFYQPAPWLWLRADAGVNFARNRDHIRGVSATSFEGLVEMGLRLELTRRFSLTW